MSEEEAPYSSRLAATLTAIDADALPSGVVDKARLALLDYLACAFEARERAWCRQAVALAAESSARLGGGESRIIGHVHKVALDDAVFANAVLGHGLVRDDMHLGSVSHLGAVIMPVALGLAGLARVGGQSLVAAIVAGYEAGGRIGRLILDVDVTKIHRPTGITGPFAAAAAAARLLGLDTAATASALALAANTAAGSNQWAADGGDEMYFHAGFAARNGLTAARLAGHGARPSLAAVDGPAGLLAAFGKRGPARADGAAGLEIESVFFKQVPACNYAQSPAQAARALAERAALSPDDVAHVTVRVSRAAAEYPGCDARGPFERELQAKMSIQYNVAAALLTASFDDAAYDPARNARVCALAARVELVVDAELTRVYPARQAAEVVVRTAAGRELAERADDVAPAGPALVRERFVRAAGGAVGDAAAERILTLVDGIESSPSAGDLLALAVPRDPA